jgi:hypothetical protein
VPCRTCPAQPSFSVRCALSTTDCGTLLPLQVLDSGHTQVSYARLNYDEALEAAVNEQIK